MRAGIEALTITARNTLHKDSLGVGIHFTKYLPNFQRSHRHSDSLGRETFHGSLIIAVSDDYEHSDVIVNRAPIG